MKLTGHPLHGSAGTSGGHLGVAGRLLPDGGGRKRTSERVEPILKTLAPPDGYLLLAARSGSGHFVKMVHNGIEYAMMQGYAEGFEIMQASRYPLDLGAIAKLWMQGSVVRSWLLDLTAKRSEKGSWPGASSAVGGGFGRRPLDGGGVDQYGGSGSGDRTVADDAVPIAAGEFVRCADAGRHAPTVRRTCC